MQRLAITPRCTDAQAVYQHHSSITASKFYPIFHTLTLCWNKWKTQDQDYGDGAGLSLLRHGLLEVQRKLEQMAKRSNIFTLYLNVPNY